MVKLEKRKLKSLNGIEQAEKLKSCEMKEGRMKNEEGWMKNEEWRMMKDEWRMKKDERSMMKDDDFKLLKSFALRLMEEQTDRHLQL